MVVNGNRTVILLACQVYRHVMAYGGLSIIEKLLVRVVNANFESTETCSITNTGVDNKPNIAESDFSPAVVEFLCVFACVCVGSPTT